MKKRSFLLMSSFIALSSYAGNLSGCWTGSGTMTRVDPFTGTTTSPCESIRVMIEHIEKDFKVQRYYALCDKLNPDWMREFVILENKVFLDEEEVGTFENDLFKTQYASGGVARALNFRMSGPTQEAPLALLESYYGVRNLMGTIVIEGNLNPAEMTSCQAP